MDEIKAASLELLGTGGPDALSLRAVARSVGVSVQALYHYVDGREALITELVTDAYTALGAAVRAGGATGSTREERLIGAGLAYRQWAHDNRAAFMLALGAPLPDYAAPQDGPTTLAATAMGSAFQGVVFDGWTKDEVGAVPVVGEVSATCAPGETQKDLPAGALQLFITGWASLHGFVMLEVHGHLSWMPAVGEQTCRAVLTSYAATVERARTASG